MLPGKRQIDETKSPLRHGYPAFTGGAVKGHSLRIFGLWGREKRALPFEDGFPRAVFGEWDFTDLTPLVERAISRSSRILCRGKLL